ncbi:Circumsporozoite protein-like protein [Argiope bruennichi]|uniref:Circumsporozoite protein-like protein n=1 Tax=Argiope bruennichi TaxID=94029 RepID=A0A8T0EFH5_ARGBR|nr:Circumsporozoite protein-like protein [Argiope bruennichi]
MIIFTAKVNIWSCKKLVNTFSGDNGCRLVSISLYVSPYWIRKFGIPVKRFPPLKDEVDSLDPIIPHFSRVVALFQRLQRIEEFLTKLWQSSTRSVRTEDQPVDVRTEDQPVGVRTEDQPVGVRTEDQPVGVRTEDQPVGVRTEDQPVGVRTEDQPVGVRTEDQPVGVRTEDQPVGVRTEDQPVDVRKVGLPDHIILPKDVPWLIAYSLAVCVELILYKNKNNKIFMHSLPRMWEKYFNENLKHLCDEARFTEDHLKAAIGGLKCPEKFLDEFIAANKNDYDNIEDKFYEYAKRNCAVESPEFSKFIVKRSLPKRLAFLNMKVKFKGICKCVENEDPEERPLLASPSSCSSNSSQTSSSNSMTTTV